MRENIADGTGKVLEYFEHISAIPRCSKQEGKVSEWIKDWAAKNNFSVRSDTTGNLVISVPPTNGYESATPVVLQNHLDMVCEKTKGSKHDFTKDPIRLVYDGDWLRADETSLGADNGIGVALCLALVTDNEIVHPPLELLFTVEEETGLEGAKRLEAGFIRGRWLINVDSETEGVFTIGSAGGRITELHASYSLEQAPTGYRLCEISVSGLKGGHSGIDIHRGRCNANVVLAKALCSLSSIIELQLLSLQGGTRINAIPRDASARVLVRGNDVDIVLAMVNESGEKMRAEYGAHEPAISLKAEVIDGGESMARVVSVAGSGKIIQTLNSLPDGVWKMSEEMKGLVETSNNLGKADLKDGKLTILSFQRSAKMDGLDKVTREIVECAQKGNMSVTHSGEFPVWEPDMHSPLLVQCLEAYKRATGEDAEVSAIHAGLECSIIGTKYPEIDMISLGPTIKDPHSPDERLFIPSLERVWKFFVEFFK